MDWQNKTYPALHVSHLFKSVLDFFLPASCSYCRSPVDRSGIPYFCSACWADFSLITGASCPRCGRSFESPEALSHSPDHLCGQCRRVAPHFDQAISIGQFEGALREAIHQFKYRPCRTLGSPLSSWMAQHLTVTASIDVVMPVPLHRQRLRLRGFNQALLLARGVALVHQLPLSYDNLVRIRPTKPQVDLSGEERIRNVAGAFSLRRPQDIEDRRVLLVDDVFTTGATLNECAAVVRKAGAACVTAVTLARAI